MSEKKCSHCEDNQGLCHQCGIVMNIEALKLSGYWQEGMIEGKHFPHKRKPMNLQEHEEPQ